jgi:hypothetical protein
LIWLNITTSSRSSQSVLSSKLCIFHPKTAFFL